MNQKPPKFTLFAVVACLVAFFVLTFQIDLALAADDGATTEELHSLKWSSPLVIVECLWFLLVAVGFPTYSYIAGKCVDKKELRGLNMPRGSVRAILALIVVGSFVNVLIFGAPALGPGYQPTIVAFGALTGSIIGFYFGNRTATPPPP